MTNDQLPERDPTKTNAQQGLYAKFRIERTDGSSVPGGKHHGCNYFVLDVTHDKCAPPALAAYAVAVERTHPLLAADMRRRYGLPAAGAAAMPVVATWRERVKHLDRPTDFAERNAAVEEARDLRWALQDAYARTASMRTEWGAEVAALTERAEKARAWSAGLQCRMDESRRRIAELEESAKVLVAALHDAQNGLITPGVPSPRPWQAGKLADMGGAGVTVTLAQPDSLDWGAPAAASEAAGVAACVTCGAPVDVPSTGVSNRGPDPSCVWGPEHLAPRPSPGLEFDHRGVLVPVSPAPRDTAAMLAEHMVHVGNLEHAASHAREFHTSTVPNPIEALRAARDAVEASAKRMLGTL